MENAKIINDAIRKILPIWQNAFNNVGIDNSIPEFLNNANIVSETFIPQNGMPIVLSKELIFKRLALIDLFFSTNVFNSVNYGLHELTDAIWKLCEYDEGQHSDSVLANKIYIFSARAENALTKGLLWKIGLGKGSKFLGEILETFQNEYGCCMNRDEKKMFVANPHAEAILSIYFHYISVAFPDVTIDKEEVSKLKNYTPHLGFPIYDSNMLDIMKKVESFLGINHNFEIKNIVDYTDAIKAVIRVLCENDPELWDYEKSHLLKVQIIDFLFRTLHNVMEHNYSKLLSKSEYEAYIMSQKEKLPKVFADYEDLANNLFDVDEEN